MPKSATTSPCLPEYLLRLAPATCHSPQPVSCHISLASCPPDVMSHVSAGKPASRRSSLIKPACWDAHCCWKSIAAGDAGAAQRAAGAAAGDAAAGGGAGAHADRDAGRHRGAAGRLVAGQADEGGARLCGSDSRMLDVGRPDPACHPGVSGLQTARWPAAAAPVAPSCELHALALDQRPPAVLVKQELVGSDLWQVHMEQAMQLGGATPVRYTA